MNRRLILVWLALIVFIMGASLCPFNDLNGERSDPNFMKEEMTMTVFTNRMTSTAELRTADSATLVQVETATFALG
jgi:hypothetical protein